MRRLTFSTGVDGDYSGRETGSIATTVESELIVAHHLREGGGGRGGRKKEGEDDERRRKGWKG